jgi:hypothetical protein
MEETNLHDDGVTRKAFVYGRIMKMYTHTMPMGPAEGSTTRLIADCDWYMQDGINPVNGLIQLKRNLNFDSARVVFLKNCVSRNFVFWPSDPNEDPCTKWDLIEHHE